MSSIKSSKSSIPIESLIKSSVIPDLFKSFLLNCAWVVLAGWITRDLVSPILAKWEKSFKWSINFMALFFPPLIYY